MSTPGTGPVPGPRNRGLDTRLVAAQLIVLLAVLGLEVFGGAVWLKVLAGVGVMIVGLVGLVTLLRRR